MDADPVAKRRGVMAAAYFAILDAYLQIVLDVDSIFMHDNARIPMAKITHKWL